MPSIAKHHSWNNGGYGEQSSLRIRLKKLPAFRRESCHERQSELEISSHCLQKNPEKAYCFSCVSMSKQKFNCLAIQQPFPDREHLDHDIVSSNDLLLVQGQYDESSSLRHQLCTFHEAGNLPFPRAGIEIICDLDQRLL